MHTTAAERARAHVTVVGVEGMFCPDCARRVTEHLRQISGVRRVVAEFGDRRCSPVFLEYAAPATREVVASAVAEAGFRLHAPTPPHDGAGGVARQPLGRARR